MYYHNCMQHIRNTHPSYILAHELFAHTNYLELPETYTHHTYWHTGYLRTQTT